MSSSLSMLVGLITLSVAQAAAPTCKSLLAHVPDSWCANNCLADGMLTASCQPDGRLAATCDCTGRKVCPMGEFLDDFKNECTPQPVWNVPAEGEGEKTVCFSSSWNTPKGSRWGEVDATAIVSTDTQTCATLSYSTEALIVEFQNFNDDIQQNAYGPTCNTAMWNQEVVEMFLTSNTTARKPETYYEFETTPTGGVFMKEIYNRYGDRSSDHVEGGLTAVSVPCEAITVVKVPTAKKSQWNTKVSFPFSLIGQSSEFRANFFRVQMDNELWADRTATLETPCGLHDCSYHCANCPTTTGPNFHQSEYFGLIRLV